MPETPEEIDFSHVQPSIDEVRTALDVTGYQWEPESLELKLHPRLTLPGSRPPDRFPPGWGDAPTWRDEQTRQSHRHVGAVADSHTSAAMINLRDWAHTAQWRGWGAGWPSCTGVSQSGGTLVVTAPRSGTRMSVNRRIARLTAILIAETERRGYLLKPGQCGSYNCRCIAKTRVPSNHSWALANDFNWLSNPYSTSGMHDIPDWMYALWARYGYANGRMYTGAKDCVTGDMMVITENGSRAIRELAGQETVLLSTTGDPRERGNTDAAWVKAPVASYGYQPTYEVVLARRGARQIIRCTAGHRWPVRTTSTGTIRFIATGKLNSALRQGDTIPAMRYPEPEPVKLDGEYVARGIVWGDGSVYNRHGGRTSQARVQLCGPKVELRPWIVSHARYWRNEPHGISAYGLSAEFKALPHPDTISLAKLAGFFAGWFACDGHVHSIGAIPPSLSSSDARAVAWIQHVAPRLGLTITSIRVQPAGQSGFNSTKDNHQVAFRRVPEWLLVRAQHRDRQPERRWFNWRVETVRATGIVEQVFCPTVADRHVMALASPTVPILTGQSMHLEHMGSPLQCDAMTALAIHEIEDGTAPPVPIMPTDNSVIWVKEGDMPFPLPLKRGDGVRGAPDRRGALHWYVLRLQAMLNVAGPGIGAPMTGEFMADTEAAVRALQGRRGLTVDGVLGPATFAHLLGNDAPDWA